MFCASYLKIYKGLLISNLDYLAFNSLCLSILVIAENFYLTINSFQGLTKMKSLATLFVFLCLVSIFGSTMARYLLVDIGSNDEKIEDRIKSRYVGVSGNICFIKTVSVSTVTSICFKIWICLIEIYTFMLHMIFNVSYVYCKQVWRIPMRIPIQRCKLQQLDAKRRKWRKYTLD